LALILVDWRGKEAKLNLEWYVAHPFSSSSLHSLNSIGFYQMRKAKAGSFTTGYFLESLHRHGMHAPRKRAVPSAPQLQYDEQRQVSQECQLLEGGILMIITKPPKDTNKSSRLYVIRPHYVSRGRRIF
jgi:hypothetical protein